MPSEVVKQSFIQHVTQPRDGGLDAGFGEGVIQLALKMAGLNPNDEVQDAAAANARKTAYREAQRILREEVIPGVQRDGGDAILAQITSAIDVLDRALGELNNPAAGQAPVESGVMLAQLDANAQDALQVARRVIAGENGCRPERCVFDEDVGAFNACSVDALFQARACVAQQICEMVQSTIAFVANLTADEETVSRYLRSTTPSAYEPEQLKKALRLFRDDQYEQLQALLRQWLLLDEVHGRKTAVKSVDKLRENEERAADKRKRNKEDTPSWFERHAPDVYYALSCVLIFGGVAAMYVAFPPAAVVLADNVVFGGLMCGTVATLIYMLLNNLAPSRQQSRLLTSLYSRLSLLALMILAGGVAVIFAPAMPAVLAGVMSTLVWKIVVACSVGAGVFGAALLIHTVSNGPSEDARFPLVGYMAKALFASLFIMPMIMVLMPMPVLSFAMAVLPHGAAASVGMLSAAQLSALALKGLMVGSAILYGVVAAIQSVGALCKWIARDYFKESKITSRYFNGMGTGLVVSAPLIVASAVAAFIEFGKAMVPTLLDRFFVEVAGGIALCGVWLGGLIGAMDFPIEEDEGKPWNQIGPFEVKGAPSDALDIHTAYDPDAPEFAQFAQTHGGGAGLLDPHATSSI